MKLHMSAVEQYPVPSFEPSDHEYSHEVPDELYRRWLEACSALYCAEQDLINHIGKEKWERIS